MERQQFLFQRLQIGVDHLEGTYPFKDIPLKRADLLISPFHPHKGRHAFAYLLSAKTGGDEYELERRLGHRSRRYIGIYTNPPEKVSATYIEDF